MRVGRPSFARAPRTTVRLAGPVVLLAMLLGLSPASAAGAPGTPTSLTATAPASVTYGHPAGVFARLTSNGQPVAGETLTFSARPAGRSYWSAAGTATTNDGGWAAISVRSVRQPTEYVARFAGDNGMDASASAPVEVHIVNLRGSAPRHVIKGKPARIVGHLMQDTRGLPGQRVEFVIRTRHGNWSAPHRVPTNANGVATWRPRLTKSTKIGIRFPGSKGLAPSPFVVTRVKVQEPASGFVFPFEHPAQAQSPGSWSEDQGVDLAADGYACGSHAMLVAVGNGTIIQEGIQGFGPTAPVIRMANGPFAGRNVYYGHTGKVFVRVGDRVQAGQRIAEIGCGQVGYSSAPHLEIGVGEPGGPPCCPSYHQTSGEMWHQLVASRKG